MTRKLAVGLTFLMVVVGVASAQDASSPPAPGGAGQLVVATSTSAPTLDPELNQSQIAMELTLHVFDSLVTYDENYKIIPDLATSWDVSSDGTTYTFHLAKGITFQDGETMTSADVVASLERAMAMGQNKNNLAMVSSVKATDASTVVVTLKHPYAMLLQALATPLPQVAIMPAKYAENHQALKANELVGTGPYAVAKWVPDQYLLLSRFKDYTPANDRPATGLGGNRIAYYDSVKFVFVKQAETRLTGLKRGDYAYAQNLPITAYDSVAGSGTLKPDVMSQNALLAFWLNQTQGQALSNLYLRQAVVAALNDTAVLNVTARGNKKFFRASGSLFWPEQAGKYYADAGKGIYNQPDQAKVKQLLAKAGYQGESLTIVTNHNYPYMYNEAVEVNRELNAAGIKSHLKVLDWAGALALVGQKTGWDMFASSAIFKPSLLDWKIIIEPNGPLDPGFKSQQMGDLLAKADTTFDPAARTQVYQQIQDLTWQQVPFLPIGLLSGFDVQSAKLHGYKVYFTQRFWNVY